MVSTLVISKQLLETNPARNHAESIINIHTTFALTLTPQTQC